MNITQLLLTTDFSTNARLAYPCAAAIAREFGAVLHLSHAIAPAVFRWGAQADDLAVMQEVESLLKRELAEHTVFAGLETSAAAVRHRWPHKGLEEYAEQAGIGLIVTATHGWTGVMKFLLGSFAERLANNAKRPVLVAREHLIQPIPFAPKEVLVPYDFTPASAAVLPMVRLLSQHYGSRFTFQCVYGYKSGHAPFMTRLLKNWIHETSRIEQRLSEMLVRELSDVDARVETCHGVVYEEVLRKAEEISADLVLLVTHGLLGSVAQNVLRAATCPVLTVYSDPTESDW